MRRDLNLAANVFARIIDSEFDDTGVCFEVCSLWVRRQEVELIQSSGQWTDSRSALTLRTFTSRVSTTYVRLSDSFVFRSRSAYSKCNGTRGGVSRGFPFAVAL